MKPITERQVTYLSRLIARVGKQKYLQAKATLGITVTIMRMSSKQAYDLIAMLRQEGKR